MNIPKKVKVGGLTYQVEIVETMEETDCAALIDIQKLQIKIEKAELDAMEHNFLHELIHAINTEIPEREVEFFTMLFHQVVVDNPDLFKRKRGE